MLKTWMLLVVCCNIKKKKKKKRRRASHLAQTKQRDRTGRGGKGKRRELKKSGMAPPAPAALLLPSNHSYRPLLPRPILHHATGFACASASPSPPPRLRLRLRHAAPLRAAALPAIAIAPGDHWGNWAFLLSAAAFGTWYRMPLPSSHARLVCSALPAHCWIMMAWQVGGVHVVGRRAQRLARQHHGRPGRHGHGSRHGRRAGARRRHGLPAAGHRPAPASRRRPPPRRQHHRRPPQGLPHRIR